MTGVQTCALPILDGELEDVDMEPDDSEFDDDAEMEFDEYYDDDME